MWLEFVFFLRMRTWRSTLSSTFKYTIQHCQSLMPVCTVTFPVVFYLLTTFTHFPPGIIWGWKSDKPAVLEDWLFGGKWPITLNLSDYACHGRLISSPEGFLPSSQRIALHLAFLESKKNRIFKKQNKTKQKNLLHTKLCSWQVLSCSLPWSLRKSLSDWWPLNISSYTLLWKPMVFYF